MKRALLAGFRGHSPRWFEWHGELVEITAVAGPVGEHVRRKMPDAGWAGRRYDDPLAMLEREDADIALIWPARTDEHVPLALKALERGLHVMVEKPISEDLAEARRLVDAAAEAGRLAMVMQDVRWQTAALEVKEALEEGAVGTLYWLELGLRGLHESFIYEGIHLVDLARFFTGREAEWVRAAGASPAHRPIQRDNVISLTIGFTGGVVARVVMDWSCLGFQHWIEARLHGDRAAMDVTWGQPIRVQAGAGEPRRLPKWEDDQPSMRRLLSHFLHCIETGETPINSAADHLKTLAIIFAGWESLRTGDINAVNGVNRRTRPH